MTSSLNNVGIVYEENGNLSVYVAVVRTDDNLLVSAISATSDKAAEDKALSLGEVLFLDSISGILNTVAVSLAMTEMEQATGGREVKE
jgi:hypothetical protein